MTKLVFDLLSVCAPCPRMSTHVHCWESTPWGIASAVIFPYLTLPCFLKQALTELLGLELHSCCSSLPSSWCPRLKFVLFLRLYLMYLLTAFTQAGFELSYLYLWNYRYTSPCLGVFLVFCFVLLCWNRISLYGQGGLKPQSLLL